MLSNQRDDRPRLRPSSRNGNRLPLRMPGERIGGRKKGTPNKMSRDFKEAIIAAWARGRNSVVPTRLLNLAVE
jgi:hypothetical protein